MEKLIGQIIKYDDKKRFGFIRLDVNHKDIFFHIRNYRPNKSPTIGEKVMLELGEDKQGRMCAVNIQELSFVHQKEQEKKLKIQTKHQRHKTYQDSQQQKQGLLNVVCIFALVFLGCLAIASLLFGLSKWVFVWYVAISCVSFVFYWHDKYQAQNNQWRVPENQLHFIDVLGGWVGASIAHKILDHKTTKAQFRIVYYLSIIINIMGLVVFVR